MLTSITVVNFLLPVLSRDLVTLADSNRGIKGAQRPKTEGMPPGSWLCDRGDKLIHRAKGRTTLSGRKKENVTAQLVVDRPAA